MLQHFSWRTHCMKHIRRRNYNILLQICLINCVLPQQGGPLAPLLLYCCHFISPFRSPWSTGSFQFVQACHQCGELNVMQREPIVHWWGKINYFLLRDINLVCPWTLCTIKEFKSLQINFFFHTTPTQNTSWQIGHVTLNSYGCSLNLTKSGRFLFGFSVFEWCLVSSWIYQFLDHFIVNKIRISHP